MVLDKTRTVNAVLKHYSSSGVEKPPTKGCSRPSVRLPQKPNWVVRAGWHLGISMARS